jgi:hypothetical protein
MPGRFDRLQVQGLTPGHPQQHPHQQRADVLLLWCTQLLGGSSHGGGARSSGGLLHQLKQRHDWRLLQIPRLGRVFQQRRCDPRPTELACLATWRTATPPL